MTSRGSPRLSKIAHSEISAGEGDLQEVPRSPGNRRSGWSEREPKSRAQGEYSAGWVQKSRFWKELQLATPGPAWNDQ